MKKILLVTCCWLLVTSSFGQTITQKLQNAFDQFEADPQLKHAISSLYVIDANTGKVVFDKNSQIGLAPASTQKIITAATAFELLGKDYRYNTDFILGKDMHDRSSYLFVHGSGDPTLGSWRYINTKDIYILSKIYDSLRGLKPQLWVVDTRFDAASLPDGYIWQDIGNYYGAGSCQLNWKENQYDVFFESDKEDLPTIVTRVEMDTSGYTFINEVKAGKIGSGDNAYIYSAPYSKEIFIRGTIPPNQKSFSISGANPDPVLSFGRDLKNYLENRWKTTTSTPSTDVYTIRNNGLKGTPAIGATDTVYTHHSPSLDSIIYWFLKKSINLYGEALVKTFAYEKNGFGSTDSGVAIVQDFWKQKGIDEDELNISDGSGLSPQNRVTTHAQVEILKYARTKDWYPYFYDALPLYNQMKMKSGTIKDVKGFCGYHKAKDGQEYIFSFLVNNYSGRASELVNKMYKVLNVLK